MLKTNSKKARENIRLYIVDHFSPEDFTETPPEDFHGIASMILDNFRFQKWHCIEDYRYYRTEQAAFIEWCSGLPSIIDTCYYYNRPAANDLAEILEETPEERDRYTEAEAEECLSRLIYRELTAAEV